MIGRVQVSRLPVIIDILLELQLKLVLSPYCSPIVLLHAYLKLSDCQIGPQDPSGYAHA